MLSLRSDFCFGKGFFLSGVKLLPCFRADKESSPEASFWLGGIVAVAFSGTLGSDKSFDLPAEARVCFSVSASEIRAGRVDAEFCIEAALLTSATENVSILSNNVSISGAFCLKASLPRLTESLGACSGCSGTPTRSGKR